MYLELKTGIKLYYEIKGNRNGYPLLFLHGNEESLEIYNGFLNDLEDYKIILVDSRCHGKSSSGELSYELMAEDILEFINYLSLDNFSLIGFSDGGIIGLLLGMKLKNIDRLFLIGPNINPSGLVDDCINWFKEHDSIYSRLCLNEPDINPFDLSKIESRSIIIGGEFDLIKREHLELIKNLIPNSYLYILKDSDHFIPQKRKNDLITIIKNELLIDVYYEDNHVIVVDKKSGVLSQADDSNEEDLLSITKKYLKVKYDKPGNVYLGLISRLDRNVSGLMVLSKTTKATTRLNENRPKKNYYAIVYGSTKPKGDLVDHISKDEKTKRAYIDENGKIAILHYNKVDEVNGLSLLDVKIETGRFHQIRFQLSNMGSPIFNDQKYAGKEEGGYEIGLDAYSISFIHPVTKERVEITRKPKREIYKIFHI